MLDYKTIFLKSAFDQGEKKRSKGKGIPTMPSMAHGNAANGCVFGLIRQHTTEFDCNLFKMDQT